MSKKPAMTAALAITDEPGTALAPTGLTHDELAALGDIDLGGVTGLEEAGAEDVRIAIKTFNMKRPDKQGRPRQLNVFYDTVDDSGKEKLDLVLLSIHKTNLYSVFNNASQETEIKCRSSDRKTGTMADGTARPCEGCPDAQWKTIDGKRSRNCGPVYNVYAEDRETMQPCIVRFKKTSLPVIQNYLNKHFLNRRVVNGVRADYPLFAFQTIATLKLDPKGTHAIPELERGPVLSRAEIERAKDGARFVRDVLVPSGKNLDVADKDSADEAPPPSAGVTFSESDFKD